MLATTDLHVHESCMRVAVRVLHSCAFIIYAYIGEVEPSVRATIDSPISREVYPIITTAVLVHESSQVTCSRIILSLQRIGIIIVNALYVCRIVLMVTKILTVL